MPSVATPLVLAERAKSTRLDPQQAMGWTFDLSDPQQIPSK